MHRAGSAAITRNVADLADPPSAAAAKAEARKSVKTWTPAQLRLFLEHAHGHRLYAAFLLGAMTGMRRGEVLGLRWTDNTETGRDGTLETANFTP